MFEKGERIRLPGETEYVTVFMCQTHPGGGIELVVTDRERQLRSRELSEQLASEVERLVADGGAKPADTLAGLWTQWMLQAAESVDGTALGSAPLKPFLHQHEAVYGAMLPQPMLRFMLADEPGTGKTIMAGLYATEASRLGIIDRMLVVCPAHLVGKWQDDVNRFFGRDLRRITADTLREHALEDSRHQFWVVSLQLAAANPQVREALDPDIAGWDLVVLDEAHRLTPTAQTFFQVGLTVAVKAPRALLMTATPHRGSEWLFRSLMHLTDPHIFPLPIEPKDDQTIGRLKPGPVHFLRRMKEELVDLDGATPLFKKRTAHNISVPLNLGEKIIYDEALRIVDEYFPRAAVGLGRMVYGKRAASSLFALKETLRRRSEKMGTPLHPQETVDLDEEDLDERELVEISHIDSRSAREETRELRLLIERIEKLAEQPDMPVSKWPKMADQILSPNGIAPGGEEQVVVFTEYADTAEWLTLRFRDAGFSSEMYSGKQSHEEREMIRARFAAQDFQIIVSTDAGNEGIDLQAARVLANWDVPWSLVTLEQRMGRIHRVGQDRDVDLYNLIATDTREGDAHETLLNNLVAAANELDGRMFDCLALIGEMALEESVGTATLESYLASAFDVGHDPIAMKAAVAAITKDRLRQIHTRVSANDDLLASRVDVGKAVAGLNEQQLDRINPSIVERYLTRLKGANAIDLSRSAVADEGLWNVKPGRIRPLPFGTGDAVLVATSGESKTRAVKQGGSSAEAAIPLGPNERPFRQLVNEAQRVLGTQLHRGARLEDPTSITDYRLFVYTADVFRGRVDEIPGKWRHASRWSYLVKADSTGTRVVPWETLANLRAEDNAQPLTQHPAEVTNSQAQAEHEAEKDGEKRRKDLNLWLKQAATQLDKLPNDLTDDIDDPETRVETRKKVKGATEGRKRELEASVEFEVGELEIVGWAHVGGTATPAPGDEDANSELVAMQHVTRMLNGQGWKVADVHSERLGYDLKATKGSRFRAVEVKGIKASASSSGITVTGAELATAGLHGSDYWLYVVDHCTDGIGKLFAAWADPATVFAGATKDIPALKIKGSDLQAAKERSL